MSDVVKEVVGTSIALVVGLSDRSQITFQSGFAEDESDEVVNARLDRLNKIAKRQQAIAEIPHVKAEIRKKEGDARQFGLDRADLVALHDKAMEGAAASLLELREKREAEYVGGYNAFRAAGRAGDYRPSGHTKSSLDAKDREIEAALATAMRLETEHQVAINNIDASIKHAEACIAALNESLSELEALAT